MGPEKNNMLLSMLLLLRFSDRSSAKLQAKASSLTGVTSSIELLSHTIISLTLFMSLKTILEKYICTLKRLKMMSLTRLTERNEKRRRCTLTLRDSGYTNKGMLS